MALEVPTVPDVTDPDLAEAWDELFAAFPDGWAVGRPVYDPGARVWTLYAFLLSERPTVGKQMNAWTAVAPTELGVVAEMARCLREIDERCHDNARLGEGRSIVHGLEADPDEEAGEDADGDSGQAQRPAAAMTPDADNERGKQQHGRCTDDDEAQPHHG